MEKYIGIDLGGTKIKGLLADASGRVLASKEIPTRATEGQEAVFDRILGLTQELASEASAVGTLRGIGVGAPGPLDAAAGLILITENLPFENFPIARRLQNALGLPTFLENDGNVAAMGEFLYGEGAGANPLIYLTLSTGIGAGALIDGRVFRGRCSNALEAGHITLKPDGPLCACGNRGCAEALASGTAIAMAATEAAQAALSGAGAPTSLSVYPSPSAREVFIEAERGDAVSEEIASRALLYIGICASTIVTLFDPEVLVVGGGVMKAGPRVLESIKQAVGQRCARAVADSCRIISSAPQGDSGARGAAALAALSVHASRQIKMPY